MAEPQIKDQRGWAPVDTGYLDNPKMLDVLDASGTATLMHLASILYCAQHLTDGHISPGVARRKVGATKEDDRLLIDAGLWHEAGHDCAECPQPEPNKVYVHDFLQHNRTAAKAKRVSERRSEAARARWAKTKADDAPPMQSALQGAQQSAMQNGDVCNAEREREREKEREIVTSEDVTPPRPDVEQLCRHLQERIVANGSKRPNVTKKWRDSARLMLDTDGRTAEQIAYLIDWSQNDEFWKGNILSMPKLREKFDTLRMQSQRTSPGQKPVVGIASQMEALKFYEGK